MCSKSAKYGPSKLIFGLVCIFRQFWSPVWKITLKVFFIYLSEIIKIWFGSAHVSGAIFGKTGTDRWQLSQCTPAILQPPKLVANWRLIYIIEHLLHFTFVLLICFPLTLIPIVILISIPILIQIINLICLTKVKSTVQTRSRKYWIIIIAKQTTDILQEQTWEKLQTKLR